VGPDPGAPWPRSGAQLTFRRSLHGFGTAVPIAAEPNLVTNGDFETPVAPSPNNILSVSGSQLDGWTIQGNGVMDVTNKNFADNGSTTFPVYSGNQSLDLNSLQPATMTQDLTTVVGSTYHVFFALTGVPPVSLNECPAGSVLNKSLTVSAGSSSHDYTFSPSTADPSNPNNQSFVTEEFEFVAAASTTTLEFASTTAGCAGPVIDAVSVTLVTTPVAPPLTPLGPAAPVAAAPAFTG
jgi:hypothetical protein